MRRYTRNTLRQMAETNFFNENFDMKKTLDTDITPIFWKVLEIMVKKKEIIVGNTNGKPGDGKSVLIATICRYIQVNLLKKGWDAKSIDRDEQEFSEWVKDNHSVTNVMRMIDEHSTLYEVGENSTTEKAFFQEYSDLFRSNYINRWYCSPTYEVDKNCVITLEVASTDKEKRTTQAYVFYNLFINNASHKVPLGMIDVYVGNTLDSKWYAHYEKRKSDRQKMILEYGFKTIREMMYAELNLYIFEEMKDDTKINCKLDRSRVYNVLEIVMRDKKMMLSLIGTESRIASVLSALKIQQEIYKAGKGLRVLRAIERQGKKLDFKQEMEYEDLNTLIDIDSRRLNKTLNYWRKAIELKKVLMEME